MGRTQAHSAIRTSTSVSTPGPIVRPYRGPDDHPALARIGTAARAANGSPEQVHVAQLDNYYAHLTNCDLPRDCRLVELDGQPVAYGRTYWVDRNSGERVFEAIIWVDPAAVGRGVEAALLDWQVAHLDELAAANPSDQSDRPAILAAFAAGSDATTRELLEGAGFVNVRRGASLVRPNLEDIPDLPLPNGFELRPIDPADRAMHRRVFDAMVVAVVDHWGNSADEGSDANFELFVGDPLLRPDLWRVAFHGDEIAGQILNFLEPAHDDGTIVGWTESITVQPQFRRRGLARALLAESLRTVRDAGATYAALGVDTDNVRRALDLYESMGFRIVSDEYEYQRPALAAGPRMGAAR